MKFCIKFMCYVIALFMVIWISGCSSKFGSVGKSLKSVDQVMVHRSYFVSKPFKEKGILSKKSTSYEFLNQQQSFINNDRYVYNYINKGSYSSHYYVVQPGDTLFYIAWLTGNNFYVLAKKNNISVNDVLKVGQILKVGRENDFLDKKFSNKTLKNNNDNKNRTMSSRLGFSKSDSFKDNVHNDVNVNKSLISKKNSVNLLSVSNHNSSIKKSDVPKCNVSVLSNGKNVVSDISSSNNMIGKQFVSWCWPAVGKVVNTFSSSEGGNRGIDISGYAGQSVFSARSGKVVYVGDFLFGYGNLIIIKHDNDFLSTYAHNDKILVIERQNVVLGQKIATMGSSGSDIVKLHFEIRYKGRSVDPLYYLPKK